MTGFIGDLFGAIEAVKTQGVVLLLVASSMKAGTFTVGDFALFVYYLGVVAGSIIRIGEFLVQIRQTRVSISRLFSLQKNARERDIVEHKDVYIHGKPPELPRTSYTPQVPRV